MKRVVSKIEFPRLNEYGGWSSHDEDWEPSGTPGCWRSNGGGNRNHVARSFSNSLFLDFREFDGEPKRLHLIGVFAMYAEDPEEPIGNLGASIGIVSNDRVVLTVRLYAGRHYERAEKLDPIHRLNGDGSSLDTVGTAVIDGMTLRVDRLSIDLPPDFVLDAMKFLDLGSSASFVLLDAYLEGIPSPHCPFHSRSSDVSLQDLGAVVRIHDRVKFRYAVDQLQKSLLLVRENLDESRGLGLTFIAVVAAALLEAGGSRRLHRFQLDAARALENEKTIEGIADTTIKLVYELAPELLLSDEPRQPIVNKALSIVERGFATDINDDEVARSIGLSTSHFRHLFRQEMGMPFHQYVIATRLERARKILSEQNASVTAVSKWVGFKNSAHFSRAFQKRFGVPPSAVQRANR